MIKNVILDVGRVLVGQGDSEKALLRIVRQRCME